MEDLYLIACPEEMLSVTQTVLAKVRQMFGQLFNKQIVVIRTAKSMLIISYRFNISKVSL